MKLFLTLTKSSHDNALLIKNNTCACTHKCFVSACVTLVNPSVYLDYLSMYCAFSCVCVGGLVGVCVSVGCLGGHLRA